MECSKTTAEMENQVETLFEELELQQTQLDEIIQNYDEKIEKL